MALSTVAAHGSQILTANLTATGSDMGGGRLRWRNENTAISVGLDAGGRSSVHLSRR
jgi:hypothetical protein